MLRNDILDLLKDLGLHGAHGVYDELLEHGRRIGSTPEKILLELLRAEKTERHTRGIRYRLGIAKFPMAKDLEGFDFSASAVSEDRTGSEPCAAAVSWKPGPTSSWSAARAPEKRT